MWHANEWVVVCIKDPIVVDTLPSFYPLGLLIPLVDARNSTLKVTNEEMLHLHCQEVAENHLKMLDAAD
jgi:hypothetical protein